ncbi:uncharacterized protein [Physcomitrium patens]|uniref:uncharacterized protein n=1 Tax=Physcomitrium patens TaxID=3218 RepID=UPI003CCC9C8E
MQLAARNCGDAGGCDPTSLFQFHKVEGFPLRAIASPPHILKPAKHRHAGLAIICLSIRSTGHITEALGCSDFRFCWKPYSSLLPHTIVMRQPEI